jgi:uncharacterized membrane protein
MGGAAAFETARRSVVKSLSWRLLALIITSSVAFGLTRRLSFAAEIGVIDTAIKLFVYFAHERVWNKIDYGRLKAPDYQV